MTEYIFCIDSDGCAMDTMTYKHELFFGPLAARYFNIENKEAFQKYWEKVNLYSKNRGVNRFTALVMCLENSKIKNIENLKKWVNTTDLLSNVSLEKEIVLNPSEDLQNALDWSNAVNETIQNYNGDSRTFAGVKEGLRSLKKFGKVYIVSSANKEAVEEEWRTQNLMNFVDKIFCQDRGKKEDIISSLIQSGIDPKNILMIGDSPGDCYAAEMNKVAFYPILVGDETRSWENLSYSVVRMFIEKNYNEDFYKEEFWNNLENIKS